ncbi:hypothetical protein Y590_05840 [Methylobacterium sp. AMS5]|nr:hypothetical protein Y590_05840 [Methylobacterium sp. AMS5]
MLLRASTINLDLMNTIYKMFTNNDWVELISLSLIAAKLQN